MKITDATPIPGDGVVITLPQKPDFLNMPGIDDDTRAVFAGRGGYFNEAVLLVQLIKELQLLRERLPTAPEKQE